MLKKHPFLLLDRNQATQRLAVAADAMQAAKCNRLFYDGKHWNNGTFWVGPIPATSDKTYADIKAEIARIFCSRNVIKEVVDHIVDGVLGKAMARRVVPKRAVTEDAPITPEEQKLLDEIAAAALAWFNKRKLVEVVKEIYGRRLLGERVCGRVYVPRGRLDVDEETGATTVPEGLSLEQYLDMIFPHVTDPGMAGVETDEATLFEGAIYLYEFEKKETVEIVFAEPGENGDETVIRTLRGDTESEHRLNLGGRLTIYEAQLRTVITQQVRENQMALNLARTMQSKNVVMGGFLERVILDAMPPGKWVQDPEHPDDPTKKVFKVGEFTVGAGSANFFMAAEYIDEKTGEIKFGNPRVYWKDPVPPDTFIAAARDYYQGILEEVGQAHILISGDATASGKSREQAERTYRRGLEDDAAEIEALTEWFIETALAMAYDFMGQASTFAPFKAECQCFIETGTREAAQRAEDREKVAAGQLSREEAMRLDGIEDPQAEMERIKRERILMMSPKERAELYAMWIVYFDEETAAALAYLSDEEKELVKNAKPKAPVTPPENTP